MPGQHHAMIAAVSLSRNEKTEQRIVEKLLQDADPRFRPASDGGARFSPAGAVQVTWASVDYLGPELETKAHEVFTIKEMVPLVESTNSTSAFTFQTLIKDTKCALTQ